MSRKSKFASFLAIFICLLSILPSTAFASSCRRGRCNCDCCKIGSNEPALVTAGPANTGYIFVRDSTGITPNTDIKSHTISDGDELTMSLCLRRLVDPDSATVTLPEGILFDSIVDSSMFTTSAVYEYNWAPEYTVQNIENGRQLLTVNLQDISRHIDMAYLQFKCLVTQDATKHITPAIFEGQYISENPEYSATFRSDNIYSLQMRIKTVDMDRKGDESLIDQYSGQYVGSGAYQLYYDEALTEPVAFSQGEAEYIYTAVNPENPDKPVVNALSDKLGMLVLNGLHEGTYYLKQIQSPDGYNQIKDVLKVDLASEYKYDPNDPINIMKEREKEEKAPKSIFSRLFENMDKTESEKREEERLKDIENRKLLESAAEYHANNPKQIVAHVSLADAPHYAKEANTETNADVVIVYNANRTSMDVLMNITIIIALTGLGATLTILLNKKRRRVSQ